MFAAVLKRKMWMTRFKSIAERCQSVSSPLNLSWTHFKLSPAYFIWKRTHMKSSSESPQLWLISYICDFMYVATLTIILHSTDRSKAVVPMLVLFFVAFRFILRGDLLYVFPCVILFLCFSVLLVLRLPRLDKERANLSAFHTFVRFVLV